MHSNKTDNSMYVRGDAHNPRGDGSPSARQRRPSPSRGGETAKLCVQKAAAADGRFAEKLPGAAVAGIACEPEPKPEPEVFLGELAPDKLLGPIVEALDIRPLENDEEKPMFGRREKTCFGCAALAAAVGLGVSLGVGLSGRPTVTVVQNKARGRACNYVSPWMRVGSDITHPERFSKAGYPQFSGITRAFGSSVSLSTDGNRLAVSGRFGDGASVYELDNATDIWIQLGPDITDGPLVFDAESDFIEAISAAVLSGDGGHVAVTFPHHSDDDFTKRGLVRVYEYTNESWEPVGDAFLGTERNAYLGDRNTVDLSDDGCVIAIGDYRHNQRTGRVRVFRYAAGTRNWTQLGSDLCGEAGGDQYGEAVSLSSDGAAVAIGSSSHENNRGQVRVFRYSGGDWTQMGEDIEGGPGTCVFGWPVSLSADASRVAVSSSSPLADKKCVDVSEFGNDDFDKGEVRVYEFEGGNWAQMGPGMVGDGLRESFGWAITLSGAGAILAVGSEGSNRTGLDSGFVRTYHYEAGKWTQAGKDIVGASSGDWTRDSVSLSYNGERLAVGSPTDFLVIQETSGVATVYHHCW